MKYFSETNRPLGGYRTARRTSRKCVRLFKPRQTMRSLDRSGAGQGSIVQTQFDSCPTGGATKSSLSSECRQLKPPRREEEQAKPGQPTHTRTIADTSEDAYSSAKGPSPTSYMAYRGNPSEPTPRTRHTHTWFRSCERNARDGSATTVTMGGGYTHVSACRRR